MKGESAMQYKDDIGSRVLHTYQIYNRGPWRVSNLEIHIDWPFQVANNKPLGKWLLYMEEKPYIEGECASSRIDLFRKRSYEELKIGFSD